jgi:CheY-like chemotaxis protein
MSEDKVTDARRLALVDDDATTRRALKTLFEEEGWRVDAFATGEDALEPIASGAFTVLVTDNVLPGIRGIELTRRARATNASIHCVIISGYEQPPDIDVPWFTKPIDFDALVSTLERSI